MRANNPPLPSPGAEPAVCGDVGEGVGACEVEVGFVGEGAVRVLGEGAVGWSGEAVDGEGRVARNVPSAQFTC
jgi:hypothetical protein